MRTNLPAYVGYVFFFCNVAAFITYVNHQRNYFIALVIVLKDMDMNKYSAKLLCVSKLIARALQKPTRAVP